MMQFIAGETCKFCYRTTGGERHHCSVYDLDNTSERLFMWISYSQYARWLELDKLIPVSNNIQKAPRSSVFTYFGQQYYKSHSFYTNIILPEKTIYITNKLVDNQLLRHECNYNFNMLDILNNSFSLIESFEKLHALALFS